MTLTSRAMRIVKVLLEQRAPIAVKDLAGYIRASERAIRYDFKMIEPWLIERDLTFERRAGTGVFIVGTEAVKALALGELAGIETQRFPTVVTADDRMWAILGWVLSSRLPVSIEFLAPILGVSKRSIYYDIDRLGSWLQSEGLELVIQRGKLSVIGNEFQCRGLMMKFLERCLGTDGLGELVALVTRNRSSTELLRRSDPVVAGLLKHLLDDLGDPDIVWKIGSILTTAQSTFRINIPAGLAGALTAHLLVMLARVKQGRGAPGVPDQVGRLRRRPEWAIAVWITSALEELFSLSLPESETASIAQYIMSCEADVQGALGPGQLLALSHEELGLCARMIVQKAEKRLAIDLMADVELRAGLVGHLYASLEKIRSGFPARNPLLPDIQRRFPKLYSAAVDATRDVGAQLGLTIPEDEAGWLTLHLGAALERLVQLRRSWRAIVACPSGLGVAQLLRARLGSEFPHAELRTVSALDERQLWESARQFGANVVITTIALKPGPIPVVVVSPFLSPQDVTRVTATVYARTSAGEDDLLREFQARNLQLQGEQNQGPALAELIREELIAVDVEAADAVGAIRQAGNLLRDGGVVTSRYADAMVDLYRRFGPYSVLAPGVAVPHAAPGDGALKLGIGVLILRRPVRFGSPHNDPVDVIIPLASPDHGLHWRALAELMEFLQDRKAESLRTAKTRSGVAAILRGSDPAGPQE